MVCFENDRDKCPSPTLKLSRAQNSSPRISLYEAVTGGNDWALYYEVMLQIGSFYPAVFLIYTFFFIFAARLSLMPGGCKGGCPAAARITKF